MSGLRKSNRRRGAVLILVVMLLFVLLAIAGLLIDIGMARLTQSHMRSVSDAAAIEGAWQLAMGADEVTVREAVVRRAEEMSESWGSKRVELVGGYDLDDDGKFESAQTIHRGTLGDPVRTTLDPNLDNEPAGDIVLGEYREEFVPDVLPGQPIGYARGSAFTPNVDSADSILVRLRRTGEIDIAGGTPAERLTYLWSRGSLLDFGLKGDGIAVRSETIVQLAPAVAIGSASSDSIPSGLPAAIPLLEVTAETFARDSLMRASDPLIIGSPANGNAPAELTGIGYLPIAKQMSSGQWRVVGFTFAEVTESQVIPTTLAEHGFAIANASANLEHVIELSDALIATNRSLSGPSIARAPRLVRSYQIQGESP